MSRRRDARRKGKHRIISQRTDRNVATVGDLPDWLAHGIAFRRAAWAAGTLRTCPHNPTPAQVGYMVYWKPELVCCARPECSQLTLLARDHEHVCDCCGRRVANTDDDHLYSALIKLHDLCMAIAICANCRVHRMRRSA